MQEYYIYRQKNEFVNVYEQIEDIIDNDQQNLMVELSAICSKMNINMVITDKSFTDIYASTSVLNRAINAQNVKNMLLKLHEKVDIDFDKGYGMMMFEIDNAGEMLILEGAISDEYYIFLLNPIVPMIRSVSIYRDFILYISIIVAFISAVAAYFISKGFTKPINDLVDISDRISKMDFQKQF